MELKSVATTTVKAHQRKGVQKVLAKAKAKTSFPSKKKKDQSRVFIHVSKNPASRIQSGAFMSFAKYRFAIIEPSSYKIGGKKSKTILSLYWWLCIIERDLKSADESNSQFADWQKIKAVNIFIITKTNYHLRALNPLFQVGSHMKHWDSQPPPEQNRGSGQLFQVYISSSKSIPTAKRISPQEGTRSESEDDAAYKCSVCETCYFTYSSWTRHIATSHPDAEISCKFKCDICNQLYDSKRAAASHHSKSHGKINCS